jgi:hypothetical protein
MPSKSDGWLIAVASVVLGPPILIVVLTLFGVWIPTEVVCLWFLAVAQTIHKAIKSSNKISSRA